MKPALTSLALLLIGLASTASGGELLLKPTPIPEMKAVYGTVQARDAVLARARTPGTLIELTVTEGDVVQAGDTIARIKDDRIDFQVKAVDAELSGLKASLANASAELLRAQQLLKSGAGTSQRVDQLQTQVDVTENQIRSGEANRSVLLEQAAQGAVLAPSSGTVLSVPVTRSAVVMAGETVATIGGGGFFLRLAIPERHAASLKQGAEIRINSDGYTLTGTLAKIYPEIAGGRVTADVTVPDLDTRFVGGRLLVDLPVGERQGFLVPAAAVSTRAGLDFVAVRDGEATVERAVITGQHMPIDGVDGIEILTGLAEGDRVVTP